MRTIACLLMTLVLLSCAAAHAAGRVSVDILFMNHGPLRATLDGIREVLARHEGGLSVAWHDFESQEGREFMRKKGIEDHVPLLIWINGSPIHEIDGDEILFRGFPSGSGPAFFQGGWDMDKLDRALGMAVERSRP